MTEAEWVEAVKAKRSEMLAAKAQWDEIKFKRASLDSLEGIVREEYYKAQEELSGLIAVTSWHAGI